MSEREGEDHRGEEGRMTEERRGGATEEGGNAISGCSSHPILLTHTPSPVPLSSVHTGTIARTAVPDLPSPDPDMPYIAYQLRFLIICSTQTIGSCISRRWPTMPRKLFFFATCRTIVQ